MSCGGSRHADFEKIHSAFLAHYSKDPKLGESRYADWVKFSGLDETQSYYLQGAARANKSKQSFEYSCNSKLRLDSCPSFLCQTLTETVADSWRKCASSSMMFLD